MVTLSGHDMGAPLTSADAGLPKPAPALTTDRRSSATGPYDVAVYLADELRTLRQLQQQEQPRGDKLLHGEGRASPEEEAAAQMAAKSSPEKLCRRHRSMEQQPPAAPMLGAGEAQLRCDADAESKEAMSDGDCGVVGGASFVPMCADTGAEVDQANGGGGFVAGVVGAEPPLHSDSQSSTPAATNIGTYRLGHKKLLGMRRRTTADVCLALAALGVALMIAETECNMASVYGKEDAYSYAVKSLISASTVALLVALVVYHVINMQLYTINNSHSDWRVMLTSRRVCQVLLELALCAIHPPPGTHLMNETVYNGTVRQWVTAQMPMDVYLSLPMFTRLFLVVRCMRLHSELFDSAAFRTVGSLNKIRFDGHFILKTVMTFYPGRTLAAVVAITWLMSGWMIRYCEFYENDIFSNYFAAVYMTAITFMTVGYGDVAPITYCGRAVAVATGMLGAGCTALVVAVVTSRLQLSRSERLVHKFIVGCQLNKQLKDAAANVLAGAWRVYKQQKLNESGGGGGGGLLRHQRRLVAAIRELRQVREQQHKAKEEAAVLVDVNAMQTCLFESVCELKQQQADMVDTLRGVEKTLRALELQLKSVHQRFVSTG